MPYIGRGTDKLSNVEVLDNITFDGSSSYTLQKGGSNFTPSSANTLLLSIDGVVQAGNFTVSGSTIDFGTAVAGTSTCDFILHYGVGLITTPSDGTVTTAKLADSSVSLAKLTATGTKDATTFLRGDNTFAEAGGGKVNQVIVSSSSPNITVSSDTELYSGTITPSATDSKILIIVDTIFQLDSNEYAGYDLYRGSLASGTKIFDMNETGYNSADTSRFAYTFHVLDTPNTTSAITYTVVASPALSSTVSYGRGQKNLITMMEILV